MRPSRMTMRRLAQAAVSALWVTMMMVVPLSLIFVNSSRMELLVTVSSWPVGAA